MPHTHVTTTRTWPAACAAFIAAWAGFISSCDTPTPRSSDARRISAFDTTASCAVSDVEATCDHCIVIDHVVALGAGDGEGFLEDNGTLRDIVRDSSGRYWVGQRETVKVFDSQGRFITSVGRSGRGPMEFAFAQPVHLDASGRVHILDVRNLRLTIVSPDLTVAEERRLPGPVNAAAPLEDGDRYVVQMWAPTPERLGDLECIGGSCWSARRPGSQ